MTRSVIVAGARTPIGKFRGSLAGFTRDGAGGDRDPRGPRTIRRRPRAGRVRDHGPRDPGRGRPDHRAPGRGRRGDPQGGPRDHGQQGLPVRALRDRDGRPDDPGRRARDRGGGRHGVHDQRAVPDPEGARRLAPGRHADARLHGPRRPVVELPRSPHGRGHRHRQPRARHRPRGAGHVVGSGRIARAAEAWDAGRLAEEVVAGRGAAAQGRSRSCSIATKACGRTPASSRWPR